MPFKIHENTTAGQTDVKAPSPFFAYQCVDNVKINMSRNISTVYTQTSLCSLLISLETPNDVQSVA